MQELRWKRTQYWEDLPRWKKELLEVGNEDAFVYRYFAHRVTELKDFHLRLIDTALNATRGLVLYPAGHGKTTLTDTVLTLLEVCRWPDIRILIVAKNDEEANAISNLLQAEMVDNELLIHDFGPFKPGAGSDRPWSLGRMEVANRTVRKKESTLTIIGAGASTVLGYRTDWTICDDVVTEKNSASPTQRIKMREWFDLAVETGPEHADSRLTVVGTRFDPQDLYGDLIEIVNPETGRPHWRKQHEDAVADEEKHLPLWPEEWPWERLMLKKETIGTLSFNKRYRNIAVDASRIVVKEAFIKGGWWQGNQYPGCLDRQFRIGDWADDWRVVCGFDPAAGGTRMAKFCAHTVLGMGSCKDHERCYWVIDLDRAQYTLPQQVELLINQHRKYQASKTLIESNSFQIGLHQAAQLEMDKQGIQFVMEPHYTNRTNKPDPELGVQAMAPWFEKGAVHIPWGDTHSQRKMRTFVDELVQYPDGRTTDTVMSFWFAWRDLQITAPLFKSFNRLDTTRTTWGSRAPRMGSRVVQNPYYARRAALNDRNV